MFDQVPFWSACWKVHHGDFKSKFICQRLESCFPKPTIIGICTARVRLDHQLVTTFVFLLSNFQPPRTDGRDGKCACFMWYANHHISLILVDIVNPVWDRFSFCIAGKIGFQNIHRLFSECASWIAKLPNQFFFLAVHADDWLFFAYKSLTLTGQVLHLLVSLFIWFPTQAFPILFECIPQFFG